jgi:hypothetical protein
VTRCIHNWPIAVDGSGCARCGLAAIPCQSPPPTAEAIPDRDTTARRRDAMRAAVFAAYGQSCACCGTTEQLTIDHVRGDGAEHHRALFGRQMSGVHLYSHLIRQGYPEGFQTLCMPCNRGKGQGEACRLNHTIEETA